jgi:hypothetical protein
MPMRNGHLNVGKEEIIVSHFLKKVRDGKLVFPVDHLLSNRMDDGQPPTF